MARRCGKIKDTRMNKKKEHNPLFPAHFDSCLEAENSGTSYFPAYKNEGSSYLSDVILDKKRNLRTFKLRIVSDEIFALQT